MKTYIYQEIDSPARGFNKRIIVYRMVRNRPIHVGSGDRHTAAWRGAHGEAVVIIHEFDGVPYGVKSDGETNRYSLRGELGQADKYTDRGQARDAVRLFGI
jgi:hypothetical protein